MKNLSIVIMAGGKGSRWRGGGNKVLVPINGTPLIARTIHQVAARQPALPITVVTPHDDVRAVVDDAGADVWWPLPHEAQSLCRCIAETFLAASRRWKEGGWLLWGDVAWTSAAMGQVMRLADRSPRHPTAIISRSRGELFGFWVPRTGVMDMRDGFHDSFEDWEKGGRGKGWEAYRALWGLPLRKHRLKPGTFLRINDHTNDLDTVGQCRRFCKHEKVTCEL